VENNVNCNRKADGSSAGFDREDTHDFFSFAGVATALDLVISDREPRFEAERHGLGAFWLVRWQTLR
jgi:hypothetical protein